MLSLPSWMSGCRSKKYFRTFLQKFDEPEFPMEFRCPTCGFKTSQTLDTYYIINDAKVTFQPFSKNSRLKYVCIFYISMVHKTGKTFKMAENPHQMKMKNKKR